MVGEEEKKAPKTVEGEKKVPDAVEDFAALLKDYGVKEAKADTIAKYIGDTGQPDVFDDPEVLMEKLVKWPRELSPLARATILEHWGAQRGFTISPELLKKAEAPTEKREKEEEAKRKVEEGRFWFVEKDAKGVPDLRPAKKDETAMTMSEATEAMRRMTKPEEPITVWNEQLQRHMPNWNSDFVNKHPAAAWATAKEQDKAMAAGEERDPFEVMTEQMARFEAMKEVVGGKPPAPPEKSTVGELIEGLIKLDELRGGKTTTPEWMSDPLKFIDTMDKVVEKRMPKADEGAKEELKTLRQDFADLKEQLRKAELAERDKMIATLSKKLDDLTERVEHPLSTTGKTAYDLMESLINMAKDKLPDKSDVRAIPGEIARAMKETERFIPRTQEQSEQELEGMATRLEGEKELIELENWWFFGEK